MKIMLLAVLPTRVLTGCDNADNMGLAKLPV
jgi:hypothetical protein